MTRANFYSVLTLASLFVIDTASAAESCRVVGEPPELKALKPDQVNDLKVDEFALVFSWSPQHCATVKKPQGSNAAAKTWDQKFQCQDNQFGFVVHGLWPQAKNGVGKDGNPRHCKPWGDGLPKTLVRNHLCTVPGAALMQNEWQAHGTCFWSTPEDYFQKIEELVAIFRKPNLRWDATAKLKAESIRDAFVEVAQQPLSRTHIAVYSGGGNQLQEVWICLDKTFKPKECGKLGAPDLATITVRGLESVSGGAPRPLNIAAATTAADTTEIGFPPENIACPKPQTRYANYAAAKKSFWQVYGDGGSTIYCNATFDGSTHTTTTSQLPVNIEHAVPQSHLSFSASAKGDLHNLWPAISEVNTLRQNYPLVDSIPGENHFYANRREPELASCDFERQKIGSSYVIEPTEQARGKLARSILFMALAYPALRYPDSNLATYLSWHKKYPVSEEEIVRNNRIEKFTQTRNPFVDFPEYGETILNGCRRH